MNDQDDALLIRQSRRDRYFLQLAVDVSARSRCVRAQYGSIVVSADSRVVSTGFNGKPRRAVNDEICYREGLPENASKPNCCIHSEVNALLFCSPEERKGGTLYVSGIPCTDCALLILQSGIQRLVFLDQPERFMGHRGNVDAGFYVQYGVPIILRGYRTENLWSADDAKMVITFDLIIYASGFWRWNTSGSCAEAQPAGLLPG